jgi:hypothetical protein
MKLARENWRRTAACALLAGLGAAFIGGPMMGLAGLVAGLGAAFRPRLVLLLGAAALCAAGVLTVVEEPLTVAGIPFFPENHPDAELAGLIAAVLVLAGLVGTLVRGELSIPAEPRPGGDGAVAEASLSERVPTSTSVAALVAALVGALALLSLGDQTWRGGAIGLAGVVLILLGVVVVTRRR